MAKINISDLNSTGYSSFSDSESYLKSLTDNEIMMVEGGFFSALKKSAKKGFKRSIDLKVRVATGNIF